VWQSEHSKITGIGREKTKALQILGRANKSSILSSLPIVLSLLVHIFVRWDEQPVDESSERVNV